MVTRCDLVGRDDGGIGVGVGRAAIGRTLGTVGAAVGLLAVKPNQPGTVDLLHRCDSVHQLAGNGTFLIGADTHVIARHRC